MGTSNISDIGKVFAQSQTVKVGSTAASEDAKLAFKEVMSQMTNFLGDNLGCGGQMANTGKGDTSSETLVSGKEYDKYQYREVEIRESTAKDRTENDRIREELSKFEEDVKDVLKEELGVTDEQIEEAMETLGLTYVDLMNPNQLAALVGELTGTEDMGSLLCDDAFMTVMQTVQELTENLMQDLGINVQELNQLLVTAEMEQPEAGMVFDDGTAIAGVAEQPENMTASLQKDMAEAMPKERMSAPETATEDKADDADDVDVRLAEESQEAMPQSEETTREENTSSGGRQNFSQQDQQSTQTNLAAGQSLTEMVMAQQAESEAEFVPQLDVEDIIRQIAEYSRVTIANNATTMEMQLNPENLGKIYLEITSKNGVVSANITAQNEVVKEALESQIAELRQNLSQAGVKVEAVEVTVGSHEFERNLEQNAKREEQQGEEQEKAAKQTRRINLNELDELSGLMTEEETLVAQMMADQGNSVDFTA